VGDRRQQALPNGSTTLEKETNKMRSRIRRALLLPGLAALAAIVSGGTARADTVPIFSNFGPGQSFNNVHGNLVGFFAPPPTNTAVAMPFTATQTADLTGATLPLEWFLGTDFPISVFLDSNNNGAPGTILASLTQQGTIPNLPGLVAFSYTGAPVQVSAGTSYWLAAVQTDGLIGHSQDGWLGSSMVNTTIDFNLSGSSTGPWSSEGGSIISAFELDGTPVTAVPEPGSRGLLVVGALFGLGVLLAERRRQPVRKP
jgi:hypothetical protein